MVSLIAPYWQRRNFIDSQVIFDDDYIYKPIPRKIPEDLFYKERVVYPRQIKRKFDKTTFVKKHRIKERTGPAADEFYVKKQERQERLQKECHDTLYQVSQALECLSLNESSLDSGPMSLRGSDEQDAHKIINDSKNNPNGILFDKFGIEVTYEKISCLKPGQWLNDEVMNFFIKMLQERNDNMISNGSSVPRCYFFNTFFFEKLSGCDGYDFNGVRRWTKRSKTNIFSYDYVLVPLHESKNHWTLAVINTKNKTIDYYNSLPNLGFDEIFVRLSKYLKDESTDKCINDFQSVTWGYNPVKDCPRQPNCHDCGLFVLMNCEAISRGKSVTKEVIPNLMPKRRLKINNVFFLLGCSN
eukprot:GHVL01008852.1.p1 GENE.GHVL01008852.1~~GHVL01008852.1.p1  ORF type:complete len:356 (+),score=43.32 GHVL01008852.1:22-1089(+)